MAFLAKPSVSVLTSLSRTFAQKAKMATVAFDWKDALNLESRLTEEEIMVRDTAFNYSQEKLMPRIVMANRNEICDLDIVPEMGELGLLGPTLKGYGCSGTKLTKI
jgi:glutaryl-CoA dehydrogenase